MNKQDKITTDKLDTRMEAIKGVLDANTEHVIIAPWSGVSIPVTVVILSSVSLNSCGEFSTVSLKDEATDNVAPDIMAILKIKNIHENILKLCLVSPTFEELHSYVLGKDFVSIKKKELHDLRERLNEIEDDQDRKEVSDYIERINIMLSFLIPEDFMTYIVGYQLQNERTDIDKVSREMLLQAGLLADKYKARPSSFLNGVFIDKQLVDIDVAATHVANEYRSMQGIDKGTSKFKWIRGNRRKESKNGKQKV